ncbi:hypothetical protein OH738_40920 (plasmid) [Streptomyces hirsutus]|uniref:hypothetical protein n=1 Tax=Streptomyces hirsutus TaxID=35620 RepID=UPI002F91BC68|nr:hypothetical protein OH738_40920 [Streptomyces hirsutus]
MTQLEIQLLALATVLTAMFAFAGYQLAPAEPVTGAVPAKRAWRWAGASAAAMVANIGMVHELLGLGEDVPDGGRIGAVCIGVLCAAFVALVAYALECGTERALRWRATGAAFTTAMVVVTVVMKIGN